MGSIDPELRDLGVQPIAVAVTATFSQMAFAQELGVDFPLLSDWDGDVCAAYGVRYDSWKGHTGLAKRSVFVIDPDSVVRHVWLTERAEELPDLVETLSVVRTVV